VNRIIQNITKHASCLLQGIKVNTAINTAKEYTLFGGGCIMIWVCLTSAKTGEFFRIKRNGMELSTGKILEENLLPSALHKTLRHIYTGVAYQEDSECS
jgi:hypothetical protein